MYISINNNRRQACMRSHTATHLLHAQLEYILPNTRQAWSLVDEDYLRFDFVADQLLNDAQLSSIEYAINQQIASNYSIQIQILSKKDALALGAKAFFQDKYGDEVRVVTIIDEDKNQVISRELCGGTHVTYTWQIWVFKIISQQAVASGTKRILAYTWPKVYEYITQLEEERIRLSQLLDCNPKQIIEKLSKILKEWQTIDTLYHQMLHRYLWFVLDYHRHRLCTIHWTDCIAISYEDFLSPASLSQINTKILDLLHPGETVLCFDQQYSYSIISSDRQAKNFIKTRWLKWWGNETIGQGKDPIVIQLIH